MARLARIVVPGLPHHVTQRGNRRETVFFCDDDFQAYLTMLGAAANKAGSEIWAWCLMPNHVHLIIVPSHSDGLRQTIANAHRRYAARVNARHGWSGHLWGDRFGSVAMDESHLFRALAYVSLNPVRAGLVKKAEQWRWSSVHAHLAGRDDEITKVGPALSRVGDFATFLELSHDDRDFEPLRRAERVGRPIGGKPFLQGLEKQLNRTLQVQKRGRKKQPSK